MELRKVNRVEKAKENIGHLDSQTYIETFYYTNRLIYYNCYSSIVLELVFDLNVPSIIFVVGKLLSKPHIVQLNEALLEENCIKPIAKAALAVEITITTDFFNIQ